MFLCSLSFRIPRYVSIDSTLLSLNHHANYLSNPYKIRFYMNAFNIETSNPNISSRVIDGSGLCLLNIGIQDAQASNPNVEKNDYRQQ